MQGSEASIQAERRIYDCRNGDSASAQLVRAHFDQLGVISELGAKPSDLLQANGIIWVEGPSDRVYLNRWIHLFSDGALREGRDYICAFYGGALLARTQFTDPELAEEEMVNLLRVNPNIVLVCDGDRTAATGAGSRIKDRVRRIKSEVEQIPGSHIWITAAKEIENYIPGAILSKAFDLNGLPDPGQYERFFPTSGAVQEPSYWTNRLDRSAVDKMDLAAQTVPHMSKEALATRFELAAEMGRIIQRIKSWNA